MKVNPSELMDIIRLVQAAQTRGKLVVYENGIKIAVLEAHETTRLPIGNWSAGVLIAIKWEPL